MKAKRNIRNDRPDKDGYSAIRFTVNLRGERFYIETGERCHLKAWEPGMRLVTAADPYHHQINEKLLRWEKALDDIDNAYRKERKVLTQELLLKEFYAIVEPEAELEDAPPQEGSSMGFLQLMEVWSKHQENKIQLATGKPLATSTIRGISSTINRFKKFQELRNKPITFEEIDQKFYMELQHYLLGTLKQKVNNFGKHIDRLKTFLSWVEIQHDVAVNPKYRLFQAPEIYVGVDALSAQELHAIYKLDFKEAGMRDQLFELYMAKGVIKDEGSARFAEWVATMEKTRDIFLFCCYTGMRISDATKVTMLNILHQQQIIYLEATKTNNACYIPFYDDILFKPKELVEKYYLQYNTLMPPVPDPIVNEHLKQIQKLTKLERLNLTTKIGRKTFVTLKLYQGIASRLVMQATGHKSEKSFNRYAGVITTELDRAFRQGSAGVNLQNGMMMVG